MGGVGAKRPVLCVAMSAAVLLVIADAALAENYRYRFTGADEARAGRIVLSPSNLPAGWNGGPVKPDLSPNPLHCPGYYTPKESDLVVTGAKEADFTYKTGQELDTSSMVFQSQAMAETDWQRSADIPAFFRCLRAKWASLPAGNGSKIISVTRLSFPRFGTHSFAYRVVVQTTRRKRIVIDSVNIARGRYQVELDQIAQASSSADLGAMRAGDRYIAQALDAKLRAAH